MAKDTKDRKKRDEDPVATALTTPDAPVGGEGATVPAAGPPERLAVAHRSAASNGAVATHDGGWHLADTAISVAEDTARVVRRVLPDRVPAYLGGTALLVLGLADLPAVAGGVLVYEALRRWEPATAGR
jgi:hypothetical protein